MEKTIAKDLKDNIIRNTCEPIYELIRKRELEGLQRRKAILILSIFISFCAIAIIAFLQHDELSAYHAQRMDYINSSHIFCNIVDIANVDIISTPLAMSIVVFYIFIYKRRVFLRNDYKFRNIGLP